MRKTTPVASATLRTHFLAAACLINKKSNEAIILFSMLIKPRNNPCGYRASGLVPKAGGDLSQSHPPLGLLFQRLEGV
jgi:hypothetical protein